MEAATELAPVINPLMMTTEPINSTASGTDPIKKKRSRGESGGAVFDGGQARERGEAEI